MRCLAWIGSKAIQLKTSKDGPMVFSNLVVYENMEFDAEYESPIPDNYPVIELKLGQPKLPTINNRNQVYLPPNEHLGERIFTKNPFHIARLAISFYEQLFKDAMRIFK
ncbi:MAG TPA: hypothetical protein ENI99_05220 [Sedimenticola sp.]|nr:hypothetical protein [Sedimenticola sp.]